ncbi:septin-12 isoform X1 [Sceloporus undulatus]|uniref:septin-12 isoform X1 n=2 Tax=Sceloporus undulatus TaxID=8520 RepID=UPI001C4C9D77|nr:septin-12 isoform X1 [Sceloporus undulatus]XP_042294480.1 septin-12 isoform X1 [Sceloporus undulatus]
MSQLSVKEHLDGILSDFEALKRSFDVEDGEEEAAFPASSPPRSPLGPNPPGILLAPGNGEGRRVGGPILPSYQNLISLSSSSSPTQSPILKTRISSSLSFNRGTMHPPRANGTNLTRVSSFQTRLNPNGFSSSLGPGSDNESLHSSSSSLECPTPIKGPQNAVRQSESPAPAASQLSSHILKKFSSHGNVFHAEVDQPIQEVSKAAVNHSSLPSLDLHIAEDQGPNLPLCSAPNFDPTAMRSCRDRNCISPLPKNNTFMRKEAFIPTGQVGQLANKTPSAPASRQTKLQKFPISLDGLIGKPPECAFPMAPKTDPAPKPLSKAELQVNLGTNLGLSQKHPEITKEDKTVIGSSVSLPLSSGNLPGAANSESLASPFQLVPHLQMPQVTSQPSSHGYPSTEPPQREPSSPKESSYVPTERINSFLCQEVSKLQALVPPSCPRKDSLTGTNRALEVSSEKKEPRGKDLPNEEQSSLQPTFSMEEQPPREQLSRDVPSPLGTGDRKLFGYVGIEAVLDQMRIKTMKTGFEFNIMVVGQSGLGKSTMVNTLFKSKVSRKTTCPGYEERIPKTVHLLSVTHVVEEKGVKMKLTVTDTPGFGDQINNQNCWEPIIEYINDQYERYLREEVLISRKRKIPDTRVHACVYFVPPTGHWLRPLDLEFMRRLSKITNVVPVIAKADTLTLEERAEFKQRIQKDLKAHGIHVYPQVDFDDDPDDRLLNDKIREKIPFAVVGADKEHQVNGKKVLGRKTKWGVIEVENPAHCEFPLLRDLLIRSHLQDLKDITHNVHYEQYRMRRLNGSNLPAKDGECLALSSVNGEPESHL